MHHRSTLLLAPLTAGALLLAGCAAAEPASDPSASSTIGDGHGFVEGAEEVTEPQLHLVTVDPDGSTAMLDLLDEQWTDLDAIEGVTATATDGRYLFASSADTGTLTVVDSGMWTWDHEDHFHYYRSSPRTVGELEGEGEAVVAPGASGTGVFFPDTGEAVLLDNDSLADGEMGERFRLDGEPHAGSIVPLVSGALATVADSSGEAVSVQAYDESGEAIGEPADCAVQGRAISTAVGVAFPCADGALLAVETDDAPEFERIPYPEGTTAPAATGFAARENRPTVAALAGETGVWLLDTRAREWNLLEASAPLAQVTAVDDNDGHVLGLTTDGRVTVLSGETGETLATSEPLVAASLAAPEAAGGVVLVADQQRAYLNGAAERTLFEIDFADGARVARTFSTESTPAFFAETGR